MQDLKATVNTFEEFKSLVRQYTLMESPLEVTIKPYKETRRLIANAKMWAMLADFADQVVHFGQKYNSEDWKDIMTASLKGELRMAPTTDGQRLVILGLKTSKMTIAEMSLLIEFMYSFGAEKDVVWSDPNDVIHTER